MVNLMKTPPYGTAAYYSHMFQDIMADLEPQVAPKAAENIYRGFCLAIDSWLDYHESQANEYREFRERVRNSLGVF